MRPIRVAFLTNLTSTVSLPLLKALATSSDFELRHVFFYDTVSVTRRSLRPLLREQGATNVVAKAVTLLWHKSAVRLLRGLARIPQRHIFCSEYTVSQQLPHSTFTDLNQPAVVSLLADLEIDILVVCSCRQILQPLLLTAPRLGCVNVHPSLLPKFRGPMPIFWALYEGRRTTGVTIHKMSEQVDAGDIIDQFEVPIQAGENEQSLQQRLFRAAAERLPGVLKDYARGCLAPRPQPEGQGSYQGYPTPQQRRQLARRRGVSEDN
jgi:folate-dependent phosphoribosylglycinamide formyltransferase PurN